MSEVTVLQPFHWLSPLEVSLICTFALTFAQYLFIMLASAVIILFGLLTSAIMSAEAAEPVSVAPFARFQLWCPSAESDSRACSQLQSAAVTFAFRKLTVSGGRATGGHHSENQKIFFP